MNEYHNRKKVNLIFFLYNKAVISEEITGLMIMRLTFQVHPTHHHQPPTQNEEKKKTQERTEFTVYKYKLRAFCSSGTLYSEHTMSLAY